MTVHESRRRHFSAWHYRTTTLYISVIVLLTVMLIIKGTS